jgi:hypothetical protein
LAEAPFDNARPGADLILQSSDNVHFYVSKFILSLVSPVFTDMFSLPSPPSQRPRDEVQVVPLSEHSTAIDVALRHLYPVRTPKGDSLHYASILAEFARKYQVEVLDDVITGYLTDNIERDPVEVYAIAVIYEYFNIGANVARSCLNLPFSGLQSTNMRYATAEHILELVRYHIACGEAASAFVSSDRTWLPSLDQTGIFMRGNACSSCYVPDPQPSDQRRRSGPRWLWNYLYRSALVLAHQPTAEIITTEEFVLKNCDCPSLQCVNNNVRARITEISAGLRKELKNAVEQVSLSLCLLSRVCDIQWYVLLRGRFPYPRLFLWD